MLLLALDDLVFVVDLTPETMTRCRADFYPEATSVGPTPDPPPRPVAALEQPIQVMALLLDHESDPVLLPIRPTQDAQMLDTAARLLRAAMLTGLPIAHLVTEHGDDQLKRTFFARELPSFFYEGLPAAEGCQLPPLLLGALGRHHPRSASKG